MSRYCEKSAELMYTYLDKEMTFIRRARVRIHLRRCPPCGDGFVFEAKLKDRVRKGCQESLPEELHSRLRAFLQQHGVSDDKG